jgi:hypothetical protein
MSGLTPKERIDLERFMIAQTAARGSRMKTSMEYLKKFPGDGRRGVLATDIVKHMPRPKFVWYSRHALFRDEPDSLTKNEINQTILNGAYLKNRVKYYDDKHGREATNRGVIAPLKNENTCPTRRISTGNKTVVLSFCYPRAFSEKRWRPEVVTGYARKVTN